MDPASEIRIRELKRRIAQDATSPLFIGLAEEYRAASRLSEAIRTLEHGVQSHPNYLSAKIALARAYLEAGQTGDAAALFSKVLEMDPGNLISARAIAEIALARGDRLEAIKKYKLYRALSADRSVEEIIGRIEADLEETPSGDPRGRVLARLYLEQGHAAEALDLLDQLALVEPGDPEIERLRREAAVRARAGPPPSGDGEAAVRAAKVRSLKTWLARLGRPLQ
jgi:tetratricopeptide (TPR) repeat protein